MGNMASECAKLAEIAGISSGYRDLDGGTQWLKAPTAAPRSILTAAYAWNSTAHYCLGRWTPGVPRVGRSPVADGDSNRPSARERGGTTSNTQLVPLLRQSVYSRVVGYEDTNDAERLAQDPVMRVIVGWRSPERQAASTNTMSRFETEVLTQGHNQEGLVRMNAG